MDSLCLENVRGRLVKVTETDGREFIGTVETVDGKRGVMAVLGNSSLEHWHSNKYLNLFFRADVSKIHVYDHCPTREKEKEERRNDCMDLAEIRGKADLKVEKVLDNQEDVNIHAFGQFGAKPKSTLRSQSQIWCLSPNLEIIPVVDSHGFSYHSLPPVLKNIPVHRLYLVDRVNSSLFHESISRLMSVTTVGLSCEGESLGRHGLLSLLVLATHEDVFVYDMLCLGRDGLQSGLWSVLCRADLVKVVHDVRQMSDVLFHQFNIVLENVFDTMAAHIVVTHWSLEPQSRLTTAPNLTYLVRYYLDSVNVDILGTSSKVSSWRTRPLSSSQLVTAASVSVCLLPLAKVLEHRLTLPMEVACQGLLDDVRKMENEEAAAAVLEPHLTPDCMLDTLPVWRREKRDQDSGFNTSSPRSNSSLAKRPSLT